MVVVEINARLNLSSKKNRDVPVQRPVDDISREFDADRPERERLQFTPKIIGIAGFLVIVDEKEMCPDYFKERGEVVLRDIKHGTRQTDETTFDILEKVSERVEELGKEIG